MDSSFSILDSDEENEKFKHHQKSFAPKEEPQKEDSKKKPIHFREYQKEIYEKAKDKNGILYLETGTGKTFISLMLSFYYLQKDNRTKKIAFLANTVQLVRQQYLMIKNMDDLHLQMKWEFDEFQGNKKKIIIKELYSQLDPEVYDRKDWFTKFYENTNILVLTPQIFLNNLRRGYFSLKEYSLIVFDECHHTNEDHPYNNIMREFYFSKKNSNKSEDKSLPYIIGMTASPLTHLNNITQNQIEVSLIKLCENLDATFIDYDRKKIEKWIKTPECKVKSFKELMNKQGQQLELFENNLSDYDIGNLFSRLPAELKFIEENYRGFNKAISEPGQPQSEKLKSIISELQRFLSIISLRTIYELGMASYLVFFSDCNDVLFQREKNLNVNEKNKKEKLNKHQFDFQSAIDRAIFDKIRYFMDHTEKNLKLKSLDFTAANFSSKTKSFLNILERQMDKYEELSAIQKGKNQELSSENSEELQILVFAERRYVVYHLQYLLQKYYSKNDDKYKIKSGHILGFSKAERSSGPSDKHLNEIPDIKTDLQDHEDEALDYFKRNDYLPSAIPTCWRQSNKFSQINVNMTHQLKTIDNFKEKSLNLLVATSVAEEGFDMPDCNLVISYNEIKSLQSFIQVRGRARKEHSKFIILVPEHEKKAMKNQLTRFQEAIDVMTDIVFEIAKSSSVSFYKEKAKRFNSQLLKPMKIKEEVYKETKILHNPADKGGRVTLLNTNWSQQIISEYCNSLRRVIRARYESKGQSTELDEENNRNRGDLSINFRPLYILNRIAVIGYSCIIIMPLNSSSRVLVTEGKLVEKEKDAKKIAAYELVKYLYKNEAAFYNDLRPKIKSFRLEEDDDVEDLVKNLAKMEENQQDLRLKRKIQKLQIYKKKDQNLRFYYYLTNEVFQPNFLLKPNETPRYYFYLLEFYDFNNKIIGETAKFQLGFLYFGEKFKQEIGKGKIIEDNLFKVRLVIRYLTRSEEIPENIFEQMKIVDAFLWSVINNDDLNFFSIYTKENVDPKSFFHTYIKKKPEKTKYIPYNFDFTQEYLMLIILDKNKPCFLAAEKYQEILKYFDEMKEYYKFYNSLKQKIESKEPMSKKSLNLTFLENFKRNPQKNQELVVQNITNFRKFQIKHYITIEEINLEECNSIKMEENLLQRRKNLRKNFNYKIPDDDYLIKVFGMSRCIENYIRTDIQKEEAKYILNEQDLNKNLSFLCEFQEFPLEFSFMVQLHMLNKPFMSYLRDLIKTVKFKKKLLKKIDEKNPVNNRSNTILKTNNQDINKDVCEKLGYEITIVENDILKNIHALETFLKNSKDVYISKSKLKNLDRFKGQKLEISREKTKCALDFSDISPNFKLELMLLRSALMSRKYNLADNYERLEFFGDTILKALSTIQVFCDNQNKMEQTLHIERNKYISNNFLCSKSCIHHFFKYALNENFRYIPPSFLLKESKKILFNPKKFFNESEKEEGDQKEEEEEKANNSDSAKNNKEKKNIPENFSQMSNKSLADLIEALTAVVYDSNDKDISFCQYFLFSLDILKRPVYDLQIKCRKNQYPMPKTNLLERFIKFQKKIGYEFQYPGLLVQAFTHLKFREIMEALILPEAAKVITTNYYTFI